MTTKHPLSSSPQAVSKHTPANGNLLTVASLGMRVHLAPPNPDRERQLMDLITSCETLRAEWEHLFQQVIALLNEEALAVDALDRLNPSSHD
ncbi:hypothetical protein SAMN02927923_00544 [Microvirga guangxiensis]|uniref:Uncharacterized protein n=1 Tax=Microvirga guangxiensis TaxID=549386 RepID=A0A1G5CEC7_9HYPH|nr:hypothetical protein SAMN02927923_00544 [Microvirga guangxiensis]